jgi:two-component system sensor histidine kinase BaeS
VLVFVGLNPDAFVASHNIDRFEAGRELDTAYLARLSADATPVIVERLPNDVAHCILSSPSSTGGWLGVDDDLLAWNLGRARAADAVATLGAPRQVLDPTASGDRGDLCAALLP